MYVHRKAFKEWKSTFEKDAAASAVGVSSFRRGVAKSGLGLQLFRLMQKNTTDCKVLLNRRYSDVPNVNSDDMYRFQFSLYRERAPLAPVAPSSYGMPECRLVLKGQLLVCGFKILDATTVVRQMEELTSPLP